MKIDSLPNATTKEIKDGWRAIALTLLKWEKKWENTANSIWASLRDILNEENNPNTDTLRQIVSLANNKREQIIELLSEKECIRRITGASKREKEAREELARKVLDEIVWKIESVLAKQ